MDLVQETVKAIADLHGGCVDRFLSLATIVAGKDQQDRSACCLVANTQPAFHQDLMHCQQDEPLFVRWQPVERRVIVEVAV